MQHKHTKHTYEHHLCKPPELIKNQAQIQLFESTTQNFTKFLERTLNKPHLDLTLFETTLQKKPSRRVRKYKGLEKGALKIFRKYNQEPCQTSKMELFVKIVNG